MHKIKRNNLLIKKMSIKKQKTPGLRLRSETQAGSGMKIEIQGEELGRRPFSPQLLAGSIRGRKIANEGLVELGAEELQQRPKVLYKSRSRSRSTELYSARKTTRKVPPEVSAPKTSRNQGPYKISTMFKNSNLLQRLESIRSSVPAKKEVKKTTTTVKKEEKKVPTEQNPESFSVSGLSEISNAQNEIHRNENPKQQSESGPLTKEAAYFQLMENQFHPECLEIDELIRENIRRNKIQEEMARLALLAEEEKQRIARENLQEHNRRIREMNANQIRKAEAHRKSHEDFNIKLPWGVDQRRVKNCKIKKENVENIRPRDWENERVSRLGLEFIYKQNIRQKEIPVCEDRLIIQKTHKKKKSLAFTEEEKKNIKAYIKSKTHQREMKVQIAGKAEKARKAKIELNIDKLNERINHIFRYQKKAQENPKIHAKKRLRRPRRLSVEESSNEEKYQDYFKIWEGIQREEKRIKSLTSISKNDDKNNKENLVMEKIKEQLIREIDSKRTRMIRSQSQPKLGQESLVEKMMLLTQRYNQLRENEDIECNIK